MKNYKFRLEALLKLRNFKEHQQKVVLANVNKRISQVDSDIAKARMDIETAFQSMESTLKDGANAQMAQFYPQFIKAKRVFIDQSIQKKEDLIREYERERQKLNQRRGEAKVIKNMKEKDFEKSRKEFLKKVDETIEDIVQAQRAHKKHFNN